MGLEEFNTDEPDDPDYLGGDADGEYEALVQIQRPMSTHARFHGEQEAIDYYAERVEKMEERFKNSSTGDTADARTKLRVVWEIIEVDGEEIKREVYRDE